jgi:DHA2 family multidrug resistance protein-like MFS transporter
VALSLATILPVIFGIKELAKDGPTTVPAVAIMIGAGFGLAFIRRQHRLTSPLLDLRLFRNRTFRVALGVMLSSTITMGGVFLFVSQYFQLVKGYTPLTAGLWLVPPTVAMIGSTMAAARLAQRFGRAAVIGGGMLLAAAGFALLTQVSATGSVGLVLTALGLCTFGMGPVGTLVTDIVVGSVPPEKAGSAAAMSETSGEFGIATGVAVLGSIGTAVYRSQVDVPADTPAELASATRDTLATAVAATEALPPGLATQLLGPAQEAFTSGLNMVAVVAAVALAVLGVLAIALLRDTSSPEPEPSPEPTEPAADIGEADRVLVAAGQPS